MLKGIDSRITPEILAVLAQMGHGDVLALVDRNFPAYSNNQRVLPWPGLDVPTATRLVLSLMPLDTFVEQPVERMQVVGGDGSLNVTMRHGEEGSGEWQDFLADDRPLQDVVVADAEEADMRREMLVEAMASLNDREKHILTERRLVDEPQTLEELSQQYDVSRERIRQIEVRAFEKLQKAMQRIAGERLLPTAA